MKTTEDSGLFSPFVRLVNRSSGTRKIGWSTKLAVIAGLALASGNSWAIEITYTWTGAAGNGNFTDPLNWTASNVPTSSITQDVTFDANPVVPQAVPLAGRTFRDIFFNATANGTVPNYTFNDTGTFTLTGRIIADYGGNLTFGPNLAITLAKDNANNIHTIRPVGSTSTITIASNISEDASIEIGSILKTGSGTLTLSGNNTFTGGVSLSEGKLNINSATALGVTTSNSTGRLSISSGTTIDNTSGAPITIANNNPQTWSGSFTFAGSNDLNLGTGNVTLGGNRTLTVTSNTLTVGGVIEDNSNTYGLTKAGAGTLVLTGANGYDWTTTISAGTLQVGNGGTTGSIAGNITNNASLVFNRSDASSYGLNGNITSTISGTGSVTKLGAGALTLTSNNTYSGGTTISNGTVVAANSAGSAMGTGTITVSPGATLQIGTGAVNGGVSGNIVNNGQISVNQNVGNAYSGVISGNGTLAKSGTGTFKLSGANTFTGTTTITAGTLAVGNSLALANSTVDHSNASGALTFNVGAYGPNAATFGALSGTQNLSLVNSADGNFALALTVGGNNQSTTFSGNLTESPAAGSSLIKTGTGAFTLSGNNTYTGGTTISAGTLQLGAGGTSGSVVGNIVNNAALTFNRADAYTFTDVISGNGTVTQAGSNTTTLTGANTYTGGTTIASGTLYIGNGSTTGSITGNVNNNGSLVFNRSNAITFGGVISGNGTVTKDGAGTLTLTGTNTYSGLTTVNAGLINFASLANFGSGNIYLNYDTGLQWANGNTADVSGRLNPLRGMTIFDTGSNNVTFGTPLTDSTGEGWIAKSGTGTLTLASGSSFAYGIEVQSGKVVISSDTSLGAVPGEFQVDNISFAEAGGTLRTTASFTLAATRGTTLYSPGIFETDTGTTLTYGGVISEWSSLTKSGGGTLVLSGNNTYSGGTTISAGTLQIGDNGAAGTVAGNIVNNAALAFSRSSGNSLAFGGDISGTGSVTKLGGGNVTFNGNNTYSGGTKIAGGTLSVSFLANGGTMSHIGQSSSAAANLELNGGTLRYTGGTASSDRLFTLGASGGTLDASGSGALTLTATGSAAISGANSSPTLTLTGSSVATNTLAAVIGNNGTGTTSLTKSGSGNWTLTGVNTLGGTVTVSAGNLTVNSGASLAGSTAPLVIDGGTLYLNNAAQTVASLSGTGGTLSLSGNTTLTNTQTTATSFAGLLAGSGNLTKSGTGNLTLTGDNTSYTGTLSASAGKVFLGGTNAHGNSTWSFSGNSTLDVAVAGNVSTSIIRSGNTSLSGNALLNAANAYSIGGGTQNFDTLSALVATSANAVTGGTQTFRSSSTLFANVTNSVTGGEQTLRDSAVAYANATSAISGGTIRLYDSSILQMGATNALSSSTNIIFTIQNDAGKGEDGGSGYSSMVGGSGGGTLSLNGNNTTVGLIDSSGGAAGIIQNGAATPATLTVDLTESGSTFRGVIQDGGTGALSLTKAGSSSLELSGNNTFTGNTTITGGILQIGSGNSTGSHALAGSTLDYNNQGGTIRFTFTYNATGAATLGGLSGAQNLLLENNNDGHFALALTVGANNQSTTYSGNLTQPSGKSSSLIKTGTGMLTLTGNSTYTGGTTIGAGYLSLGNGGTDGSIVGNVAFTGNTSVGGGELRFNRSNAYTFAGDISGAGRVSNFGTGVTTLSGNNTYSGDTFVFSGALAATATGAFSSNSVFRVNSGAALNVANNHTIAGLNDYTTGVSGSVVVSANTTLTTNNTASHTFSGVISGDGALAKSGSSALTLAGANTYAGGTAVNAGNLILTNSSGSGTGTGNVTVASGATLTLGQGNATGALTGNVTNEGNVTFFRSDASTYGGVISGNGSVSQTGNNTLTLTGNNTYTGTTTIASGGTLKLGDGGTSGAVVGNVTNNGTLTFARSDLVSFGSTISGNGQLVQSGTGTLVLTANNLSLSGLTTVSSGGLQLGVGGTSGGVGGNLTVNSPGMVTFFRSDNVEYPLVLSGSGTLTKAGNATLTISGGSNTFTGTFVVNAGTLALSGVNTGAAPTASVAANALLDIQNNLTLTSLSGAGSTQISSGKTLTLTNGAPSFSANITGAGGVTFNNSSTIIVNETYTGPTTITSGTLNLGNGTTTGMVAGNLTINLAAANTGGVQFNRSDAVSYGGVISGNGGVTQSGTGTLTLSGNNSFSGTTNVTSGTLAISADSNLGATPGIFTSGALTLHGTTLQSTATFTLNANRGISLNGSGGTFSPDASTTLTIGGNITGGSNLTKSGAGTLVLAGSNNHGATIINAGELQLASTGSLSTSGNVTVNGGTFHTFAANQTIRGLSGSSPTSSVIIESGAILNPNLPSGESSTFAGFISGDGNLLKNGPGTLILTGTSGLGGQTTVSSGTLQIGNGGTSGFVSGNISTGNSTIGTGTVAFNRSDAVSYSSVLSGNGTVLKNGTGTLTIGGNANTFNGSLTVASGTLAFTGANTGANLTANVTSGAVLDLQNNLTLASLSGAGSTQIAANKTLTIGNFTSNFTSTITGAGGVTFNQPATITVNEAYTGPTTIKSGQLTLAAINGTTGSVAGNIVINGATDNAASVIFNRNDNHSYGGVISGNGFILKAGAGAMTLTGQNTYTGNTTVSQGTLVLGVANALPTTTRLQLGNNTVLNVAQDQSVAGFFGGTPSATITIDAAKTLKVSLGAATVGTFFQGTISGAGGLRIGPSTSPDGGHTVGLNNNNTYTGGTIVEAGGKLLLGNNTTTGSVLGNITNDGTVIFNRGSTATFAGVISGNGSVAQGVLGGTTTGDIKLTGENTYTGGTSVYSQALILGDGGTTGSIVGNVTLFNNAFFGVSRSDNTTFSGVISGTGHLGKGSTGTLTLTGQSTYTGNTEIKSGTLTIGIANALPTTTQLSLAASAVLDVLNDQTIAGFLTAGDLTSAIHLASGTTFTVAMPVANTTTTFAGTVDGSGTFAVSGAGGDVVNLTGTVANTVGTSVGTGATLNIASGGSLGGPVALGNGSTLTLANSGTQTFANVISGSGSILSSGGVTNLSAPNTYTGGTIIGGGKIIVSNTSGSATGSGPVVVNSGGTLGGSGIITGTLVLNTGSTVAPGNSPGTLTVGPTTLLGGALFTFDINNALGAPSTNWDVLSVTGGLTITATPTNPFIINLVSLTGTNGNGLLANFDPAQTYSWQFVNTTTGITGFSAGAFQYNASQFQNSLAGGFFVVSQTGNNLFLNFTPVPEPSTWAMLVMGVGALAFTAYRRRTKKA